MEAKKEKEGVQTFKTGHVSYSVVQNFAAKIIIQLRCL